MNKEKTFLHENNPKKHKVEIRACNYGDYNSIIYVGAYLFVDGLETLLVCKKVDRNLLQDNFYNMTVECVEVLTELMDQYFKHVEFYDQMNTGFVACSGKYGRRIENIKAGFTTFRVHTNAVTPKHLRHKVVEELDGYPFNKINIVNYTHIIGFNDSEEFENRIADFVKNDLSFRSEIQEIYDQLSPYSQEKALTYIRNLLVEENASPKYLRDQKKKMEKSQRLSINTIKELK